MTILYIYIFYIIL